MMVERIPWNYKWEAGQAAPEWLAARTGGYGGNADSSGWHLVDGVWITEAVSNIQTRWLAVNPSVFVKGFIAEVDIDLSEMTGSSWAIGLSILYGCDSVKSGYAFINKRGNNYYLLGTTISAQSNEKNYDPRLKITETGGFRLRFGRDVNSNVFFLQAGGKRIETPAQNGSGGRIGISPRYMTGGKVKIYSYKVYTY